MHLLQPPAATDAPIGDGIGSERLCQRAQEECVCGHFNEPPAFKVRALEAVMLRDPEFVQAGCVGRAQTHALLFGPQIHLAMQLAAKKFGINEQLKAWPGWINQHPGQQFTLLGGVIPDPSILKKVFANWRIEKPPLDISRMDIMTISTSQDAPAEEPFYAFQVGWLLIGAGFEKFHKAPSCYGLLSIQIECILLQKLSQEAFRGFLEEFLRNLPYFPLLGPEYAFSLWYTLHVMDEKALTTLEFFKILERLADYAAFSASAELVRALRPTNELEEALRRQSRTSEARRLLDTNADITVGGARDVRPLTQIAERSGVLDTAQLLDIKATLIAARTLSRSLEKQNQICPGLSGMAERLVPPAGVVDAISQALSERGEVLDSASPKLATLRREIKIAYDRLMTRLDRILNDPRVSPMLQEPIITQRGGRYVVPLRSEFKGRLRSIIHDQSSSGATLFVEPLVVVELNNEWHEKQLAERDEVRRILAELSAIVGDYAERIRQIVDALAELDMALACAKYAEDLHASEPVLLPVITKREDHPGSTITLYHARHPLLDPQTVVPVDIDLDENTFCLVITGPNTGGKTVTLKTVGLLALMAQSGLHIPAQSGSKLSMFREIYADIGDEQSIEQSLSTFSGHVTNIVQILRRIDAKSLVLFDELGAGTDPQEGAALARAILSHLLKKRTTSFIATHYPELKAFAHSTPGVVNASMEFNVKTLRPTYHLTVGLPGRSNALLIAERLGLPREIIEDARSVIDPNDLHAEDLLDEIHHQRDIARRARSAADRTRSEAENLRKELEQRLEKLEDERLKVLEKARQQASGEVESLRAELEEVRRALSRARQPVEALSVLEEKVEKLEESVQAPVERKKVHTNSRPSAMRPLKLGDKVRLRSVATPGIITALGEGEVEVAVGNLRVRARLSEIQRPAEEDTPTEMEAAGSSRVVSAKANPTAAPFRASPGMELDIRGQRAEDGLDALQNYLESAAMSGMPFVRIIHGKGTGRLRQVIREFLQSSEYVKSFESGGDKEGGDGVTVVHIK